MPDLHDLLEQRARRYEPPLDLFERVLVRSRRRDLKRRVGAGLTAAAIMAPVVIGAWSVVRSRPTEPAGRGDTPTGQEIVHQVVDASNARDAILLASTFTDGGTFSPLSEWGTPPLAEVIPTWIENVEAWGLEAQVESCEQLAESVVRCDVRTLWHTLQMEMGERWRFEFEHGRLDSLVMVRSDLDPDDRSLPLRYADLDRWESWLERNHPKQATDWLGDRPRSSDILVGFFPYDPTFAEEIGASIHEYLDSRSAAGEGPQP